MSRNIALAGSNRNKKVCKEDDDGRLNDIWRVAANMRSVIQCLSCVVLLPYETKLVRTIGWPCGRTQQRSIVGASHSTLPSLMICT